MANNFNAEEICFERDANRCRHCGTTDELVVKKLDKKQGKMFWHLSNLITLCKKCYQKSEKNLYNKDNNRVGVVLAGGRGTRLFPLTKFNNKHALSVGIIPMIYHPVMTLREFGVYNVVVVIDRENTGSLIEMLGSGKEFGMNFSYKVQEGAGGISEALNLAKDNVKKDDLVICILGDNIFDNDELDTNIELGNKDACVYLKKVSNPSDYGVAVIKNNEIKDIVEKPKEFISDLAVIGLYVYKSNVFDVIKNIKPSKRGELEISSVNDYYASIDKLKYKIVNGYWGDAGGSIQRYAECSMHGAKKANVSAEEIDNFRSIVFDNK